MKNSTDIADPHEKLREKRERLNLNQQEASERLGVAYSTYRAYESGRNTPRNMSWDEAIRKLESRNSAITAVDQDSTPKDPIYSLTASAGDGSYEVGHDVVGHVTGSQAMSAPGRDVMWVFVRGDSMGSTYQKMTMVPVLRITDLCSDIQEDDVYLFRLEGTVQIKRLQRLPGQRIRVKSDNPQYDDYHIQLDDGVDFEILGRVLV